MRERFIQETIHVCCDSCDLSVEVTASMNVPGGWTRVTYYAHDWLEAHYCDACAPGEVAALRRFEAFSARNHVPGTCGRGSVEDCCNVLVHEESCPWRTDCDCESP